MKQFFVLLTLLYAFCIFADTPPQVLTFPDSVSKSGSAVTLKNDSATPGNSKYYGTDGSGTAGYFSLPAAASPGGSSDQVQFNNSGAFAGDSGMTYSAGSGSLHLSDSLLVNNGAGSISSSGFYNGSGANFGTDVYAGGTITGINGFSAGSSNQFNVDQYGNTTANSLYLNSQLQVVGASRFDLGGPNSITTSGNGDLNVGGNVSAGNSQINFGQINLGSAGTGTGLSMNADATSGQADILLNNSDGSAGFSFGYYQPGNQFFLSDNVSNQFMTVDRTSGHVAFSGDISAYQNSFLTVGGVPYAQAYFLSTGAGYIDGGFNFWDGNGTISAELGTGRFLLDPNNLASMGWAQRQLYWSDGSTIVLDYNALQLYNPSGTGALLDWSGTYYAGVAFDNDQAWFNGGGGLNVQAMFSDSYVDGSTLAITGASSFDSGLITTNGAGGLEFSAYTGGLLDNSGQPALRVTQRTLNDLSGSQAMSWNNSGLTINKTIISYNGWPTAGNGLSQIMANLALSSKTASISSTTLLASAPTGLYRLTWYLECTTAGSAGTVSMSVVSHDDNASQTFTTSNLSLAAKGNINGTQVIRESTGVNITYSTTVTGATGSPQYALYLTLERMQ